MLDRRLDQPEVARLSLEHAVAFEPAPGPVRDALTRHLVRHGETGILVAALSMEAEHERDDDRASRLLYAAARLITDKLGAATHRAPAAAPAPTRDRAPTCPASRTRRTSSPAPRRARRCTRRAGGASWPS